MRESLAGVFCGRCDEPILPGEAYEKRAITAPSGPGDTVYFHKPLCVKLPFQSTQQSIRH